MSEPVMDKDPNKDPIRRLTNQELWDSLLHGEPSHDLEAVERELVRRLRKIAFLPPLPPKEEA